MRHKANRYIQVNTGDKTRSNFMRSLLTSLIKTGYLVTSVKRAKALKQYADEFFGRLVRIENNYQEADRKREQIRFVKQVVFGETEGKKVMEVILPKLIATGRNYGFTTVIKKGMRRGDATETYLVSLDIDSF